MEKKYPKKKKGQPSPARPRKPSPKETAESTESLYNIAIVILFGISLCLAMGALDYVSQGRTPTADMRQTIEYFE
jgi:hypothetical protein